VIETGHWFNASCCYYTKNKAVTPDKNVSGLNSHGISCSALFPLKIVLVCEQQLQ